MANNRELSQFASLINVDDSSNNISFASTISSLDVLGVSTFKDNLNVTGTLTAGAIAGNINVDDFNSTGISTFNNISIVSGVITATTFDGNATGLTGSPSITVNDAQVGGALTVTGNVSVDGSLNGSGIGLTEIVDAVDGTYGSSTVTPQLVISNGRITSVTATLMSLSGGGVGSEIIIENDGIPVGTAGTINFGSNLVSTPASAGIVTVSFTGNIPTSSLTGTVNNNQLTNDSISFGGVSLNLGQSDATPAFNLSDATNYRASELTGTVTNVQMTNSSVSYGGVEVSLGDSDATPAFDLSDATNYPTSSLTGTITNSQLAGSITNNKLLNSSVTFGGVSVTLGGSDATPAFDLSDATNYPTSSLTGTITNSQLAGSITNNKLTNSSVSFGGVSLSLGGSDATPAFDLSDATNYPTSSLTGTITNSQLAGSIENNKLTNSSVSFGGVSVTLGASDATPAFDLTDATNYRASALTGSITNSQLEGSSSLIITSNLTLYVATNGSDSNDGGPSSPWATIGKAAEYLSQRRIKRGVNVTVSIAAGTYTFSSEQRLDHPQGEQIEYVGANPVGTKPKGTKLNGNRGGSAIRGNTSQTQASNALELNDYYRTIFQFNSCRGLIVAGLNVLKIRNILIRGNGILGVLNGSDAVVVGSNQLGGSISLINCAIHNFAARGIALVFGGCAVCQDLTITNCAGGISIASGILLGDIGDDFTVTVSNCTGDAVNALRCGTARLRKGYFSNNGRDGISVLECSSIRANNSIISNNGKRGVVSRENSSIQVRGCTVTNNGEEGILAASAGYIDFTDTSPNSSVLTGNSTPSSPFLNATGNSGSFIRA